MHCGQPQGSGSGQRAHCFSLLMSRLYKMYSSWCHFDSLHFINCSFVCSYLHNLVLMNHECSSWLDRAAFHRDPGLSVKQQERSDSMWDDSQGVCEVLNMPVSSPWHSPSESRYLYSWRSRVGVYKWRKPEDPQPYSDQGRQNCVPRWAGSGCFYPSVRVLPSWDNVHSSPLLLCLLGSLLHAKWGGESWGIRSMVQISTFSHCSSSLYAQPQQYTHTCWHSGLSEWLPYCRKTLRQNKNAS